MENQSNQQNFNTTTPPDNNLIWAILSTVLCCLPLGIVAIIKSTEVNSKWQMGDYDGARKSADDAKKYAIWGAAASVIGIVLYLLFVLVLGFGSSMFEGMN